MRSNRTRTSARARFKPFAPLTGTVCPALLVTRGVVLVARAPVLGSFLRIFEPEAHLERHLVVINFPVENRSPNLDEFEPI